jgi:hypothetical protein
MGGIGAPASGFEGSGAEEAVVDGEKTLAHAISNFVQIA